MPRHYKTQKLFLHFILNEFIWEDVLREQITTGNPLAKKSKIFKNVYASPVHIFQNIYSPSRSQLEI